MKRLTIFLAAWLIMASLPMTLLYAPRLYAQGSISLPATGTVENALVANTHRLHMQIKYALQAREAVMAFIFAWQAREHTMPSKTTLNKFTRQLLDDGKDPIVAAVHYEPEQWVSIKIADSRFIEPLLRGVELVYRFTPDPVAEGLPLAEDLQSESTPAGVGAIEFMPTPLFLDALQCMSIITSYCKIPQGYKAHGGTWEDQEWCPAWHGYVMPPAESINFYEERQ